MADGWKDRLDTLAKEIAFACAPVFVPDSVVHEDDGADMYAAEDEVPIYTIGRFHWYCIRRITPYRIFGIRWLTINISHTVFRFGLEEMWDIPGYTKEIWCTTKDERLKPIITSIMASFAVRYELKLSVYSGS